MALFKFRKTPAESLADPQAPPSVEQLRLRAKYRLVGASILVLIGVLVFPLMFDKQPRPLPSDTPMVLLDPAKPNLPIQAAPPASRVVVPVKPSVAGDLDKGESIVADKPSSEPAPVLKSAPVKPTAGSDSPKLEPKPVARTEVKPEPKTEPAPEPKVAPKGSTASPASSAEAQRVQALLDGKTVGSSAQADSARFVVQVGAFAEAERVQEVRSKIERAGMKTYVQVAQTRDGPRTRVRVGPFDRKADAERASEEIKKLDLPTVILSL